MPNNDDKPVSPAEDQKIREELYKQNLEVVRLYKQVDSLNHELETANENLKKLITQRESLVHLVTHKVKGSFTRSKYIFAGILDGTFGDISPDVKKYAQEGLESDNIGIETVDLVLNAGNLQKGAVKYDMKPLDFKEVIKKIVEEKKVQAEARGLAIETNLEGGVYNVMGEVIDK
jgi:two-component system, sensor histidine kinase and response regulator